jgi:hypothetical protein
MRYRQSMPAGSAAWLLVASDQRLVSAAHVEGFATINPEVISAADVPDRLAAV